MENNSYIATIPADSGVRSANRRAEIQLRSEQQSQRHKTKRRHNASETQQHQHEYHYDDYESLPFPGRRNATTTSLEGQVEVFSAKVPELKLNEDKRNQVVVSNSSYYATIPAPSPKVNNTTAGKHSLKKEFHLNVKSLQNDLKKPQTPKSDRLFREKQLTRASHQHKFSHQSSGSEPRPPVALPARTNVHEEERSIVASPTSTPIEADAADKRDKSELRQLYKCDHESMEHVVNSFEAPETFALMSQIPVSVPRKPKHAHKKNKKHIDLRDNYLVGGTSDQLHQVQSRTNTVKTYGAVSPKSTQEDNKKKRRSDSAEKERRGTGNVFPEKSSVIQRMDDNDTEYNDRMNEHNSSLTQQDVPENSWDTWGSLPDSLERFRESYASNEGYKRNYEESDGNPNDTDNYSGLPATLDEGQVIHESDASVALNEEEYQSSPQLETRHDSLQSRNSPYKAYLKQFQKRILAHRRTITEEETIASSLGENQNENMLISPAPHTNVCRSSDEHETNGRESMSSKNKNISPSSAQKRISIPCWPITKELTNLKLAMQDRLTQKRRNSIDVGTEHKRRRSSSVDEEANGNKADSNTQTSPSLLITATRHIDAHNTNRRASPSSEDLGYNDRPAMPNGINQDRKNMKDVSRKFSSIDEAPDESPTSEDLGYNARAAMLYPVNQERKNTKDLNRKFSSIDEAPDESPTSEDLGYNATAAMLYPVNQDRKIMKDVNKRFSSIDEAPDESFLLDDLGYNATAGMLNRVNQDRKKHGRFK